MINMSINLGEAGIDDDSFDKEASCLDFDFLISD